MFIIVTYIAPRRINPDFVPNREFTDVLMDSGVWLKCIYLLLIGVHILKKLNLFGIKLKKHI